MFSIFILSGKTQISHKSISLVPVLNGFWTMSYMPLQAWRLSEWFPTMFTWIWFLSTGMNKHVPIQAWRLSDFPQCSQEYYAVWTSMCIIVELEEIIIWIQHHMNRASLLYKNMCSVKCNVSLCSQHHSYKDGFSPWWMCMCLVKLEGQLNDFPQSSQEYGFSQTVWMRMWVVKCEDVRNDFPQCSHE